MIRLSCKFSLRGRVSEPVADISCRRAVAEAWVAPDRKHLYASKKGLGQIFSFDMLVANFSEKEYRALIEAGQKMSQNQETSTTWVLSNHDVSDLKPFQTLWLIVKLNRSYVM